MHLCSQLPVVDAVILHNRRKGLNLNLYPSCFLPCAWATVKKFKRFFHYEVIFFKRLKLKFFKL